MASKKTKIEVLRRAKITEGHFKKVIKMIEEDKYCLDILNQSLAIQGALKKIDEIILEDHLSNCVVEKINKGKGREAATEIINIFKRK